MVGKGGQNEQQIYREGGDISNIVSVALLVLALVGDPRFVSPEEHFCVVKEIHLIYRYAKSEPLSGWLEKGGGGGGVDGEGRGGWGGKGEGGEGKRGRERGRERMAVHSRARNPR